MLMVISTMILKNMIGEVYNYSIRNIKLDPILNSRENMKRITEIKCKGDKILNIILYIKNPSTWKGFLVRSQINRRFFVIQTYKTLSSKPLNKLKLNSSSDKRSRSTSTKL